MSAAGIVAAFAFEAHTLGPARRGAPTVLPDGSQLMVCGMGPQNAARAARRLIDDGVGALVSWGVAGGLDPRLAAGTLVLASEVLRVGPGERIEADFATSTVWRQRLAEVLAARRAPARVEQGRLVSCLVPVTGVRDKARLFQATGALAVDLESAAIAELAREHRLPCLVVRAIVDAAGDALPGAALQTVRPEQGGGPSARALGRALLSPLQWPQLTRLGLGYRRSRRALRGARSALAAAPAPAPAAREEIP